METARNNPSVITIVGYHGNSVYRAVASIPVWVTVTWLPKFVICGRFPHHVLEQCMCKNKLSAVAMP
jgi:hypothetical protein